MNLDKFEGRLKFSQTLAIGFIVRKLGLIKTKWLCGTKKNKNLKAKKQWNGRKSYKRKYWDLIALNCIGVEAKKQRKGRKSDKRKYWNFNALNCIVVIRTRRNRNAGNEWNEQNDMLFNYRVMHLLPIALKNKWSKDVQQRAKNGPVRDWRKNQETVQRTEVQLLEIDYKSLVGAGALPAMLS